MARAAGVEFTQPPTDLGTVVAATITYPSPATQDLTPAAQGENSEG